jgi:hypothetical protein
MVITKRLMVVTSGLMVSTKRLMVNTKMDFWGGNRQLGGPGSPGGRQRKGVASL